jgi:hypothetical protein
LASLGARGLEVQAAFNRELGLADPPITWHAARDGLAETVAWLGLVTGRAAWAEQVGAGRVSASGERADLSGLLPLIELGPGPAGPPVGAG